MTELTTNAEGLCRFLEARYCQERAQKFLPYGLTGYDVEQYQRDLPRLVERVHRPWVGLSWRLKDARVRWRHPRYDRSDL